MLPSHNLLRIEGSRSGGDVVRNRRQLSPTLHHRLTRVGIACLSLADTQTANERGGSRMPLGKTLRNLKKLVLAAAPLLCSLSLSGPAAAQVTTPPYKTTVFATAPNGTSQPDSIVQWRTSVIVGFGNGVAKDGTDGKSSTIVQYSLTGRVRRMLPVLGHNDGLRIRPETDELWALQNEDGNPNSEPNLVI